MGEDTIPREVKEVDIMVMEEDMEVMLRRHGQCIICIKIIPCLFKSLRMEEEAMVVDHTIPREVKEVEQEVTEVEDEVMVVEVMEVTEEEEEEAMVVEDTIPREVKEI